MSKVFGYYMPHFFVLPENIKKDRIIISGAEAHHIVNVLRKKCGDKINVFDGKGNEYISEITEINDKAIVSLIIHSARSVSEPRMKLILYQALPKTNKMDFIIQKCTELGVYRIIPVITDRTVVVIDEQKKKERKKRWQKIAAAAAEQSGRGIIPKIDDVIDFPDAVEQSGRMSSEDRHISLIPWESERNKHLKDYLKEDVSFLSFFIGPEGGFTHKEISIAESAGIIPVNLGPRILRTETAGLITIAMVLYEKGEIG